MTGTVTRTFLVFAFLFAAASSAQTQKFELAAINPAARGLIFGLACWIIWRAHGRRRPPEAPAGRGIRLLSGAQQTPG